MTPAEEDQTRSTTQVSSDAAAPVVAPSQFPVAQIQDVRATSALMLSSKMWWVTAICLVLAFWLTWRSIPAHGPTIVIQFPDGHGLKSGDAVRRR